MKIEQLIDCFIFQALIDKNKYVNGVAFDVLPFYFILFICLRMAKKCLKNTFKLSKDSVNKVEEETQAALWARTCNV